MGQKLNDIYNKGLSLVPADYRVVVSVIFVVLVIYLIYHFLRKQLVWIIIGAILIPFVFPAARSIYSSVWAGIQKFFAK